MLAQKRFGPRAQDFLDVYTASNDAEALRVAEDFAGDAFIAYSTWAWLEAQVKTGAAPVYRYRFDLGSPGDPNHQLRLALSTRMISSMFSAPSTRGKERSGGPKTISFLS